MAARKPKPVTRTEAAKAGAMTRRRKKFEAENPQRMATVQDQPFGTSGRTGRDLGVSTGTLYTLHGYRDLEPHGNVAGQRELPGLSTVSEAREHGTLSGSATPAEQSRTLPDLAPQPSRWEDMHPDAQKAVLQRARQFGVTPESMHHALGSQVDQAMARAQSHGMTPFASHFYSGDDPSRESTPENMQPREVLKASAKANNVDFGTQAEANALTSPKSKFRMKRRGGGTSYPNDEAATFAIRASQSGVPAHEVDPSGQGIIALHGNVRRAAHMFEQREAGSSMADLRNFPSKANPEGSPMFNPRQSPKVGPYLNSWLDPHGSNQFFVSDVHSGGGGMAPHLSHENKYERDEEGNIAKTESGRNKKVGNSERESYLDIPGIHSLHDYVARNVMHERGLSSLSGMQGAQWGEEQLQRGEGLTESGRKQTLVPLNEAYPHAAPQEQAHGQLDMFGGESRTRDVGVHGQPANARAFNPRTDEPEDAKQRRASEAYIAASDSKRWSRVRSIRKAAGFEPYEGWG